MGNNNLYYPTIAQLSEADKRIFEKVRVQVENKDIFPICLVCGNRMRESFRCDRCGYDQTMEYEFHKTLGLIAASHTASVVKKRELYEKKLVQNNVEPLIMKNDELKKKNAELYTNIRQQQEAYEARIRTLSDDIQAQRKLYEEKLKEKIEEKPDEKPAASKSSVEQKTPVSQQIVEKPKEVTKTQTKVLNIGDTYFFGSYPQTKTGEKKAIEWNVLDVKDGKALLQSVYGLDAKRYNEEFTDITWEKCTLRKWLNQDFINTAFTASERSEIVEELVRAEKNPEHDTNPGKDTKDKVFLLSIQEAKKYYKSDEARKCRATEYAKKKGAYVDGGLFGTKCSWWWLRSPGCGSYYAARVRPGGSVYCRGSGVNYGEIVVRPALWISL